MSSANFAYKRAKREHAAEPLILTIDDEDFTLAPKLGAQILYALGRADEGSLAAVFDAFQLLLPGEGDYARFMALDLEQSDLAEVLKGVAGLYEGGDDSGKSEGSSLSSNGTGASSTPISSGTTAATSPPAGSAKPRVLADSSA